MASTSIAGAGPPSSPNAPAVGGGGDSQQLEVVSPGRRNESPGDITQVPISPLLLASVCFGSSKALEFLLEREDAQEGPMILPTQVFLDKLVGWTEGSNTKRRLTVPQQASSDDDAEHGVQQYAFRKAPIKLIKDVVDQPAFPAISSHDVDDGVAEPALQAAASQEVGEGVNPAALQTTPSAASQDIEEIAEQHALPSTAKLLNGVTAEGDTPLHLLGSHGDNKDFLKSATIINTRNKDLLFAVNKEGDTPLHCAARAGNPKMVSRLIKLVGSGTRLKNLLRKENGLKETALHDAVRVGNRGIVMRLLQVDPELANYPKGGTSPMYLAILLGEEGIAHILHDESKGNLSYCGPHGQNALHVAIIRGSVMITQLLKWNNSLTTQCDRDGSTPLHFASSILTGGPTVYHRSHYYTFHRGLWDSIVFRQVFEANPAPVYQPDIKGLFPIHIAASLGAEGNIGVILENFPSCAGLRNAEGRTFLHVAVQHRKWYIVSFVCRTASLSWILNMRDNDGNTALHLAVKAGMLRMFCSLYGNKKVHLNLTNNNGETPRDLSRSLTYLCMEYHLNSNRMINSIFTWFGAKHGCFRRDEIYVIFRHQTETGHNIKEAEKMKDSSQILGIGSVLIATVTFGATFALPGGYRADDHMNGGTPTLAGRYTFDAFMVANTLAFVCSSIATIGLVISGSSFVNLKSRKINLRTSTFFMSSSVTSLAAAFALGVYMVLSPVAHGTAIMVCVLSPLVFLYKVFEALIKWGIVAQALCLRMGFIRSLKSLSMTIICIMFVELWPFILIFGWAAIEESHRNHRRQEASNL